jgi:hypothetical protein
MYFLAIIYKVKIYIKYYSIILNKVVFFIIIGSNKIYNNITHEYNAHADVKVEEIFAWKRQTVRSIQTVEHYKTKRFNMKNTYKVMIKSQILDGKVFG